MRPSSCGGAALCLNAPAFYRLLVYLILMLASRKTLILLILLILKAQGALRGRASRYYGKRRVKKQCSSPTVAAVSCERKTARRLDAYRSNHS